MKKDAIFIVFAVTIILILVLLSVSGKKAPFIPADEMHRVITTDAACTDCHAPGKRAPLKASHPPKEQCLTCHKVKKQIS